MQAVRESAVDVARRVGLLTPWTAFTVQGPNTRFRPTPIEIRTLDLAAIYAPMSASISSATVPWPATMSGSS